MPLSRHTEVTTGLMFPEPLAASAVAFAGAVTVPNRRCSVVVNRKPWVPDDLRTPRAKLVRRPSGSSTDATQVFMCGTADAGFSHVTDSGLRHFTTRRGDS